jgi:hypothetical protein
MLILKTLFPKFTIYLEHVHFVYTFFSRDLQPSQYMGYTGKYDLHCGAILSFEPSVNYGLLIHTVIV